MTDAEARTVFVSDALQARLDAHCENGAGRTATSVTFAAVEHFGPGLPDLVEAARTHLAWGSEEVRYLGVGPVRIRLSPGAAGATLLDRLSDELGVSYRTWVPAVLNAYLPGRREPENMPWLPRSDSP